MRKPVQNKLLKMGSGIMINPGMIFDQRVIKDTFCFGRHQNIVAILKTLRTSVEGVASFVLIDKGTESK